MTMHLVRGMTTLNTKKRKKKNKSKSLLQAEADMKKFYKRMGVDTSEKSTFRHEMPVYTTDIKTPPTSDVIPTYTPKKRQNVYSGEYVVGIATMHKSNIVPVGKGEKPEDYATMRRS